MTCRHVQWTRKNCSFIAIAIFSRFTNSFLGFSIFDQFFPIKFSGALDLTNSLQFWPPRIGIAIKSSSIAQPWNVGILGYLSYSLDRYLSWLIYIFLRNFIGLTRITRLSNHEIQQFFNKLFVCLFRIRAVGAQCLFFKHFSIKYNIDFKHISIIQAFTALWNVQNEKIRAILIIN